ncbi:ATP synthase subunit gamma, mitochondrial [Desmophyllum pertusum]|uniref:F-ATPase gamma subunit n=1 Tax=Desmophyllum pertusum TaxID=174260 RepID=A0A9X0CU17_9CNID|nr:ATP synthase subunit gamma, mitochondrial [Desmophyllum pertusum]
MAANGVFLRGAVFRPHHGEKSPWRLKSVKNIQKITKSMKMVSAAKFGRAERELRPARVYGAGASALYEKVEIKPSEPKPNNLIVVLSSDRGLCGGIHSNLVKAVKNTLTERGGDNTKIVACGEKSRQLFLRTHADHLLMSFSEIGKRPPQFCEATFITQEILNSGFQFDMGEMYYNCFK